MERLMNGDIVTHFKREKWLEQYDDVDEDFKPFACMKDRTYLYTIIDTNVTHTETKERLVIYMSLYSNEDMGVEYHQVFARPYDMFMSKVDREKYPDIEQEYRFELLIR